MPAINVARTDTFEQQRLKINQIGDQIFNVTAGGSDLSTGLLKLGDGTRFTPSLAFTSDAELGIYKPSQDTIGFVANTKKIFDVSDINLKSYKNLLLQKNVITTESIVITNTGSEYDEGTYPNIPLIGGTGDGALAEFTVVGFDGTVTNIGANYTAGQYTGIDLIGGNGTGAICAFDVDVLDGAITNGGSGYPPGSWTAVPVTGGTGSNGSLNITVTGTTDITGNISNAGTGYTQGVYAQIDIFNVARQTFTVISVANPGVPPPNNIYNIDGTNRPVLTLEIGNTYRFDLSDPGLSTHPFYFHGASILDILPESDFTVVRNGLEGTVGAFADLVIHDTATPQTIGYNCSAHNGMGNSISVVTGTTSNSGRGATANVTVDANGNVTDVIVTQSGEGYAAGDVLRFINSQIGGGTGARYSITGVSYDSTVTAASVNSEGQNYSVNDILGIDNTFFGGFGSGFAFTVTTNPGRISNLDITSYGSGYTVGDLLNLPTGVTGLTTVLPGEVTGVATTLTAGQAQITIANTSNLQIGMNVFNGPGDVGFVAQGAVIQSIDSDTTLTMSFPADISGAANLTFSSPNTTLINVTSVTGIAIGDSVTQTSGSGVLAADTIVSSIDAAALTITLSVSPTSPGSATLSFAPSFGVGTTPFEYRVDVLGSVKTVEVSDGGNGYSVTDLLSVNPSDLIQPITRVVKFYSVQTLTFSGSVPDSAMSVGDTIKQRDGAVVQVTLTAGAAVPADADSTYTGVATSGGSGSGLTVDVVRGGDGSPSAIVNAAGFDYVQGETVTVLGSLIGGASPGDDLTLEVSSITTFDAQDIIAVQSSGGNIQSIIVANLTQGIDTTFAAGEVCIVNSGNTSFTIATASAEGGDYKILIDDVFVPNLTLYAGSTYDFDLTDSSNATHNFSLSSFEGGDKAPSFFDGIACTLDDTSTTLTVPTTNNLAVGMSVSSEGDGSLAIGTTVVSIDSLTTLTIDRLPSSSGASVLTFTGSEYTDGVTRENDILTIKVTASTPTLYYYDAGDTGDDDAGFNFGTAATLTVDTNNPKTFGSGFQAEVITIDSTDIVVSNVDTGNISAVSFTSTELVTTLDASVTGTLTAPDINGTDLEISTINSTAGITLTTASTFFIQSNIDVYNPDTSTSTLSINLTDGNLTTQGQLKTFSDINVNDQIEIETNEIRSLGTNDLKLVPAPGRIANFATDSALQIPVGDTSARPPSNQLRDGQIRFNTDTQQYEGYNATNTAWSSLGGVRDLDGNTFIKAEETVGANDNTLWFINDGINTIKITNEFLEFVNCKKISSSNINAPSYVDWNANTPVNTGDYLKYKNNLYEVTTAGTTATSGSEPTHTTGAVINGTAELTFWGPAVAPLRFEELLNVEIDPTGSSPLLINGDLRLNENTIRTDVSDLILQPNSGKKVVIDAATSLVLPTGADGDRGAAITGSIRFNTSSTQYEGYDGTNWGSLGGVKDVDQNTFIIPETAPGANENILYFYNDGNNTLQLTTTRLDFLAIDTIRSVTTDEFEVTASLVTFDAATTTLDNTSLTTTFLHTNKQYFDIGLSAGLTVDPVLRLDNVGDVYFNTNFGNGNFQGVKVFDGDLKEFELADIKLLTDKITLVKGTSNNGSTLLYNNASEEAAKVTVVAHDPTTDDKEFIEFGVIDDGTDVYATQYGNVRTGIQLIDATFEVTASNNIRLNIELGSGVAPTNSVNITFTSNVIKK